MDKKKLILPASIIIGCIIIGGFFYSIQIQKQESIERQQKIKIQSDMDAENARNELETKKYIADRKQDCLNIYKTESDKWNNVRGWRYNEFKDSCLIRYEDQKPKTSIECDKVYDGIEYFWENTLCKEGEFENSF
ncbi:MAG: hypothetical protein WC582_00585 [Patescibacteria group bacterium]